MHKKLLPLLIVIIFLLSGFTVFAETDLSVVRANMVKSSQLFKVKLDSHESKLKALETQVATIIGRRTIQIGDIENNEKQMYEYAEQMKSAMDEAFKEARTAADSKGKNGNPELVKSFETMAKAHEIRTKKFAQNFDLIGAKIKTGDIQLDKTILERMSPVEKNEFRKSLTPAGRLKLEKLHPTMFKSGTSMIIPDFMKKGMALNFCEGEQAASCAKGLGLSLYDNIGNFFVSDAEAALAAPCVGLCWAKNWSACGACVVKAGSSGISAWNSFVSCWSGCCGCKWYKPWCCAAKAWCLAKFIAKIA